MPTARQQRFGEGRLHSSTQQNSHPRSRYSTAIHHISTSLFVPQSSFRHHLAASGYHTGSGNLPDGRRQTLRDCTFTSDPFFRVTILTTMLTTRPVNRIDQPTDGYLAVHLNGPAQERIGSQRTNRQPTNEKARLSLGEHLCMSRSSGESCSYHPLSRQT